MDVHHDSTGQSAPLLSGGSAYADRFVWLFDQRFDVLCQDFRVYLSAHRGIGNLQPIMGHELFSSFPVAAGTATAAELRQLSPERVNKLFMEAWERGDVRTAGHGVLPVVSFTMEGLAASSGLQLFGPSPRLVTDLNDKSAQYRRLSEAGLPVPAFTVVEGFDDLGHRLRELLSAHGALFVQPPHSAGGEQAGIVRSPDDLAVYRARLVTTGAVEADAPLLVTRFLADVSSLSGHGIVTRGGRVIPLMVDELLLDGFRFDGFLFPIIDGPAVEQAVLALTARVGDVLAGQGYWGYYAADFLYRAGLYLAINEINVRFAGEAAFLARCSPRNLFSLIDDSVPAAEGALISPPAGRMVVTKIRPQVGRTYAPIEPLASVEAFLCGETDEFRIQFHSAPIRVVSGHFIGLAGRRFPRDAQRDVLLAYYRVARLPEAA